MSGHTVAPRLASAAELTIEFLASRECELELEVTELRAEVARQRADLAHCREVITAAVDALHRSHLRSLRRDEQCGRLLTEVRALRGQRAEGGDLTRRAA